MKTSFRSGLVIIVTSLYLIACTDDYFEFDKIKTDDWRPELALPAINSSLTLEDIIIREDTNELIQINPNSGVLEVVYSGSVFSTVGGQFIDIPDQNFNQTVSIPSGSVPPSPVPANSPDVTFSENLDLNFNTTVEIDSILLKNGQLVFTMNSNFNHNVRINAVFPSIIQPNGSPFEINEVLPATGGSGVSVRSQTPSLIGHTLDLTKGSSAFNTLRIEVNVTVEPITGNSISTNNRIDFAIELRNAEFKEFHGYIGQRSLQLNKDTININMFNNFKKGNGILRISNPTLEIDIKNSFGLESNMTFQSLKAFNPDDPQGELDINLPSDVTPNNTVSLDYNQDGTLKVIPLVFDSSNTNIQEIISFLLKEIRYESRVDFNPSNDRTQRDFFSDTSGIGLDVYLNVPFEGGAKDIFVIDTIPLDLSITTDIESGSIRTIVDNGFPVDVTLQLIFADSSYIAIDSLYANGAVPVMPAAPIDGNGDATGKSRRTTDTPISDQRFEKLSDVRNAIIVAQLNTELFDQGRDVRFRPGYRLDIGVSIRAKAKIN